MTIIAADTFNRADNPSSLGTASDGKSYTLYGTGTGSIVSNKGKIKSDGSDTLAQIGSFVDDNFDILLKVSIGDGADIGGVVARLDHASDDACYKLLYYSGGLHINKRVSSSNSELQTASFTMTPGTEYWFRFQLLGTDLRGKAWEVGDDEPSSWMVQTTDSSLTSGGVALLASTAVSGGVLFDDLSVDDSEAPANVLLWPDLPVLGNDTFVRADQSGWGTATDGQSWSVVSGAATQSIVSNQGRATGVTALTFIRLGSGSSENGEALVRLKVSTTAFTAVGVYIRGTASNTAYRFRLNFGNNTFNIVKTITGTSTDLATTGITLSTATTYWVRGKIVGSDLYGKAWADGSAEPDWMVKATDTGITGAGGFGVLINASSGTPNIVFDRFYAVQYTEASYSILDDLDTAVAIAGSITLTDSLTLTDSITVESSTAPVIGTSTLSLTTDQHIAGETTLTEVLSLINRVHIRSFAPPPPDAITVSIDDEEADVRQLEIDDAINERSTAHVLLKDPTGLKRYGKGPEIAIEHNNLGKLFGGILNNADEDLLYPNDEIHSTTDAIDNQWFLDKRLVTSDDEIRAGQLSGDIAIDLLSEIATQEGIVVNFASRHDRDEDDFSEGTLSNIEATEDGLRLALSGADTSILETTTAAFATGTLDDLEAVDDHLQILAMQALRLRGTCKGGPEDCYSERIIWRAESGSGGITIQSGNSLQYDMWIDSRSPEAKSSVQLYFSDGSKFTDEDGAFPQRDLQHILAVPTADLTEYGQDNWYRRQIDLFPFVGKTLKSVAVSLEGDKPGLYTTYFRNIQLWTDTGTVRFNFFVGLAEGEVQLDAQGRNSGYRDNSATVVNVSSRDGFRISDAYDISSVGIVRGSLISWTSEEQEQDKSNYNDEPQVKISASVDNGVTWQACTNHQPIPCLVPGMTADTLLLRQDLNVGGPDPESTPFLYEVIVDIFSSYNAEKTDATYAENTTAEFSTGSTFVNLTAEDDTLFIRGAYRDWDTTDADQTTFGTGNPESFIERGQLVLECDAGGHVKERFNFAGQRADFVAEIDIEITDDADCEYGFVYRTTAWNDEDDTFAYAAFIQPTAIRLLLGSNSSSGSSTELANVPLTLRSGLYRLKVEADDDHHIISLDDVIYIDLEDDTYTDVGYIGAWHENNSDARHAGYYDNFGVMNDNFSGTRILTAISNADLLEVGVVEDSRAFWEVDEPASSDFALAASTDEGETWIDIHNGETIPGLTPGTVITDQKLMLRETFATDNANVTPVLHGVSVLVIGKFHATGTRITPALTLDAADRAGSTSVHWQADVPDETDLDVAVGPNTSSWTDVENGDEIPFLTAQSAPMIDTFDADSSFGFAPAGDAADDYWTWDTANSRLVATGGHNALLIADGTEIGDGEVLFDTNQADQGGIVFRYVDDENYYQAVFCDDQSSSLAREKVFIWHVAGGVRNLLAVAPIDFKRGAFKHVRVEVVSTTITVEMNGEFVTSCSEGGVTPGVGECGFCSGSVSVAGGTSYFYQIYIQRYGERVVGQRLYSKTTLSSDDPTATPLLKDLVLSVRGPNIASGSLIDETDYSYQSSYGDAIGDLASKSNYWQSMTPEKELVFLPNFGTPAPWILDDVSGMLLVAGLSVKNASDTYCNRVYVRGGTDTKDFEEEHAGDNVSRSWTLGYKLSEEPVITLNGRVVSLGVKGVDEDREYYYEIGSETLTQDESLVLLTSAEKLKVRGKGYYTVNVMREDQDEQAAFALLERGSGIVERVLDGKGLNKAACEQLAQSYLDKHKVRGRSISFGTRKHGLARGQLLPVVLPEHGLMDDLFLITSVRTTFRIAYEDGIRRMDSVYEVEASEGVFIGTWLNLYNGGQIFAVASGRGGFIIVATHDINIIQVLGAALSNSNPVPVGLAQPVRASTGALSNVAASLSSVQLLAANANRKGVSIYNDSSATMYLAFASTASTSSFTVQVPPGNYYEMPVSPIYTGALSAIWNMAVGHARITELS